MTWVAVAVAGATIVSGNVASNRDKSGQKAAAKGESASLEESQRQFDLTREDFRPFQEAGTAALGQQQALIGLSGIEAQQAAFDTLEASPGQQFLRDRAQKNLVRNASAIGGLGGGNVRSALVQQGVGFAQQDLQNQFGRLGQLAGQGQTATANVAQIGGNISQNIANQAIASGQNRATGIAQQNQITQNTIGGLSNLFGQFSQRQNNSGLI